MNDIALRTKVTTVIDQFIAGWTTAQWENIDGTIAQDVTLLSGQHGNITSIEALRESLELESNLLSWVRKSNHATVIDQQVTQAISSQYLIGLFEKENRQFLFGASATFEFAINNQNEALLTKIKFQANWYKGDATLAQHWKYLPSDDGWTLGDPDPAIVSELDAPWNLIQSRQPQSDIKNAIAESYSKYSWAIDQNDISLLSDSYTPDAKGGFSPMGKLNGRHSIIGQQKNFRRHWPWMQHFADVLRIDLDQDGQHANMIVGRIVPETLLTAHSDKVYGAHYQLRVRLDEDGEWRICWFDYRPGWFTSTTVPEVEIGITHA